jgi:hypothetical protein
MLNRLISSLLLCCSLWACAVLPAQSPSFRLAAESGQRWCRGNMHTHSFWSDGDDFPESIAKWYRDRGYQFLVFTDHNTLLQKERWVEVDKRKAAYDSLAAAWPAEWIETRGEGAAREIRLKTFDEVFEELAVPQEYLLIQGQEITDRFGKLPVHLCASNTLELLPPTGGESVADVVQRNFLAAQSRRERSGMKTLVHLNHPNFGYAVTAEQLLSCVGGNFFEVYNGHPAVNNSGDETHASTERMWDIINSFRIETQQLPVLYGLATDDGHNYFEKAPGKRAQPGRGWVNVLTATLTPDALVDSLEAGRFYSSSGVSLNSVSCDGTALALEIAAEDGVTYRTEFIGTDRGFPRESQPAVADEAQAALLTRKYSDQIGRVYATVEGINPVYQFTGRELYVRAVVTSSRKHPNPGEMDEYERAWVQPVVEPRKP